MGLGCAISPQNKFLMYFKGFGMSKSATQLLWTTTSSLLSILSEIAISEMSSKRKSHPMKILSDAQLFPSHKTASPHPSGFFPHFPISPNFLPANETEDSEEVGEASEADPAASAEQTGPVGAKPNNEPGLTAHREAMNQILKKLAIKSQENLKKSKEENSR